MTSWLRALGPRLALLCMLLGAVFPAHAAAGPTDLPFALLDSFDQAFTLAYAAAERQVAELEAAAPPAPRCGDVFAVLRRLEGYIDLACDAAATALDVELTSAGALSPARRSAVLGCIERLLAETRGALDGATDPPVRAEYEATCERLREVRRLV